MDGACIFLIDRYLRDQGLLYDDAVSDMVAARKNGKLFSFSEHLAGLVYAFLTNQTKWSRIVPHLPEIDALFQNYDPAFIKGKPGGYFASALFGMKCGNISTSAQMEALAHNIEIMEGIAAEHGSMDAFITSEPTYKIVEKLSSVKSKYKIAMLGKALAWEYIRNVGIDACKPDTHLRRFFGKARMGSSRGAVATAEETVRQVEALAADTGLSFAAIDNLIWSFCADHYGQICTAEPHCEKCVVRAYCHRKTAGPEKNRTKREGKAFMENSPRTAEILCVGTELLMGNTVNTNATAIARGLAEAGISLYHQTVVGDNPARLREALELALSRSDAVITTGGLGPTYDDLTKETIAETLGRQLVPHEESQRWVEEYFRRLGRTPCANNQKQAMMPEGAAVFPNHNGTAPGCAVTGTGKWEGKTVIMLPGPPRECEPMFRDQALPYLRGESRTRLVSRCLYFYGIGESDLASKLDKLMRESENHTVAPYCKTGEVMLRVTARVEGDQDPGPILDPVIDEIKSKAGQWLYGLDVDNLETALVRALREKGLYIASAESCTGGLVAQRITSVSGASAVFEWGAVTYSVAAKHKTLGVPMETLDCFGAVSEETARAMARGVRERSGADIGISVTGNAGPRPSEGKPVGLVYVGVDSEDFSTVQELHVPRMETGEREYIRDHAASRALYLGLQAAQKIGESTDSESGRG